MEESVEKQATPLNRMRPLPTDVQSRYFGGNPDDTFVSYGVLGEGSCFFHSCLAAMNFRGYLTQPIDKQKELAYDFRCKLKKLYDKHTHAKHAKKSVSPRDFDTVVADFCDKSAWADETMIRHVAQLLGVNMIFLDDKIGTLYCGLKGDDPDAQPCIVVRWVSRSHFEPIMRIQDTDSKRGIRVRGVFVPKTDKRDRDMLEYLMKEYANQCS